MVRGWPKRSGDGAGRRLLVLGRFGGIAGGPRKTMELPEVSSTVWSKISFGRALAVKAEVGTVVYGPPGRDKGTGG